MKNDVKGGVLENTQKSNEYQLSEDQVEALEAIKYFLGEESTDDVLIITGKAGTGKTTLVKQVLKNLNSEQCAILAPTGMAAANIKKKTGFEASTIHSHIYNVVNEPHGKIGFVRAENEETNPTCYFVDEAGMISALPTRSGKFMNNSSVLADLLSFIKEGNENNKIIFMGDPNQLPPVKEDYPAALSKEYLGVYFGLKVDEIELTTVHRQSDKSNVLECANEILSEQFPNIIKYFEVERSQHELLLRYAQHIKNNGFNMIALAPSNQLVQEINRSVRSHLNFKDEVEEGDRVVAMQNKAVGDQMVNNGDLGTIKSILDQRKTIADISFQVLEIEWDRGSITRSMVNLTSLQHPRGEIPYAKYMKLRMELGIEYGHPDASPFSNALVIGYGYALTVHKAQGSEWKSVIIHPSTLGADKSLLYTAVTRASDNLLTSRF